MTLLILLLAMSTELKVVLIATLVLIVINFIASLPVRLRTALNIIIVVGVLVYLLLQIF